MRHLALGLIPALLLLGGAAPVAGQPAPVTLRLALVSQWVVDQHRTPDGGAVPDFQAALDGGVVDRPVFRWQRGAIQRRALVGKPIRVLAGPEAGPLGGRGDFQLTVRPPSGPAAWTVVEVAPGSARPDDVLVMEVGGEMNSVSQVLASLAVSAPGGGFAWLPLARRALVSGAGVPVMTRPFGQPVTLPGGVSFRGTAGVEFLVARSQVETIENGGMTANGPADLSSVRDAHGDWREGDRVFIRIPVATPQRPGGAPAIVLGWKDRVFREGGPDFDFLRGRARLPLPAVR